MSESVNLIEEQLALDEGSSVLEMARKVLLASIGAVVLAQEEMDTFVGKLVERGEIAEKDGRKLLNELRERRKSAPESPRVESEGRMDAMLKRMNIPTKTDIETLSQKIHHLTEKVEGLLVAAEDRP
ncbi:MAG: hypothetical protein KC418_19220 [Anaerolineales bacterium]|nr:hypothetical protein [Anaerolineales bacterium]MCB8951829.1 poly(hydroxyalkanoate) granule-associated protein [Ardenticatenales bacterium]